MSARFSLVLVCGGLCRGALLRLLRGGTLLRLLLCSRSLSGRPLLHRLLYLLSGSGFRRGALLDLLACSSLGRCSLLGRGGLLMCDSFRSRSLLRLLSRRGFRRGTLLRLLGGLLSGLSLCR